MRLVTRGDLDGLTCAVLITSCEDVREVLLIHPQDVTDKRVEIGPDDILANLPYHPRCGKWFDHHLLTDSNERPPERFDGRYGLAPSAARVAYEYYSPARPDLKRFEPLLAETDRLDAAQLNLEDVLDPQGYVLLGLTLDPRTGLGAYQDYFLLLLEALKTRPLEEVLALPEVRARAERMKAQDTRFREATLRHSRLDGNVVVTDFRPLETVIDVHPGALSQVEYEIVNETGRPVTGQAIPSYAPRNAAEYFRKLDCFCFTTQTLQPGERRRMPVVFVLDPELPKDVPTITLSYTFFEVEGGASGGGKGSAAAGS